MQMIFWLQISFCPSSTRFISLAPSTALLCRCCHDNPVPVHPYFSSQATTRCTVALFVSAPPRSLSLSRLSPKVSNPDVGQPTVSYWADTMCTDTIWMWYPLIKIVCTFSATRSHFADMFSLNWLNNPSMEENLTACLMYQASTLW